MTSIVMRSDVLIRTASGGSLQTYGSISADEECKEAWGAW